MSALSPQPEGAKTMDATPHSALEMKTCPMCVNGRRTNGLCAERNRHHREPEECTFEYVDCGLCNGNGVLWVEEGE